MDAPGRKSQASLEGMPGELMAMIVEASGVDNEFILDVKDASNLRQASRRIHATSFDAFAQRFFTTRKHVLSPKSLRCLEHIAQDAALSPYVRELAIGPECLHPGFIIRKILERPLRNGKWGKKFNKFEPAWRALVEQQAGFEVSNADIASLKKSLQGLHKLQKVRIDAHPDLEDEKAWCAAYGRDSILDLLGNNRFVGRPEWSEAPNGPEAQNALVNEAADVYKLHGHYARVLEAVSSIAHKPDWTLDISLNTLGLRYRKVPFDLDSRAWRTVVHRVRSVSLERTGSWFDNKVVSPAWVDRLLRDCPNLESLELNEDTNNNEHLLLRNETFANLRHLTIRQNVFRDKNVIRFLAAHAGTLESITCEDVHLLRTPSGPHAPVKAPSWHDTFEIMLDMPRLTAVKFSGLTQDLDYANIHSTTYCGDDALQNAGAELAVTLRGDEVVRVLRRAVEEKLTSYRSEAKLSLKAWFPKTE